jgi:hypothetical protein
MTNSKESQIMTRKMEEMRLWRMGVSPDDLKKSKGKPEKAKPKGKDKK